MSRRYFRLLGIVLALVLVAAACGDDSSDGDGQASADTGSDAADGDGDPGDGDGDGDDDDSEGDGSGGTDDCPGTGTIDLAMFSTPRGLDPVIAGGGTTGSVETAAIYDVLMRLDPATDDFQPWLAESLEPNEDFTEWVLTLRPDVTYGNGDALIAEDVKFNVERHQDEANGSLQRSLALEITEMRVDSDLQLTFVLAHAWARFPYLLGGPVGMIANPRVVQELGEGFSAEPIGAGVGPFEFDRNVPGEEIVLSARDDYWGGPVCSSEARFVVVSGAGTTYDALQNGDVDIAILREPGTIDDARNDDVRLHSNLSNVGEILLINSGHRESTPPTADVRLRQAIAAAIDVDAVDDRVHDGRGLATNAVVHAESILYQGLEGPTLDPELAAELVAEVIAEGEWDGTIRITCDAARTELALAAEAQLEAVGFTVELETVGTIGDLVTSVIVDANYDLACWGFNVTDEGPWAKLNRQVTSSGGSNFSGYGNDEMDAAVLELQGAADESARLEAMAEVQRVWTETVPSAILATVEEVIAVSDDVVGDVFTQETVVLLGTTHAG